MIFKTNNGPFSMIDMLADQSTRTIFDLDEKLTLMFLDDIMFLKLD